MLHVADAFFRLTTATVVQHGNDLPLVVFDDDGRQRSANYWFVVHRQMMIQIMLDFNGLPCYRDLTASEIRFFYEALKPGLKAATRPKG